MAKPSIDTSQINRLRRLMNQAEQQTKRAMSALRNLDFREADEILKRYRVARDNPGDTKSEVWRIAIGRLTPKEASKVWRYLPDPLARRGRPKGQGSVAGDDALLGNMDALVRSGVKPTTAARRLLQQRGVMAGIKGRADHLVRV